MLCRKKLPVDAANVIIKYDHQKTIGACARACVCVCVTLFKCWLEYFLNWFQQCLFTFFDMNCNRWLTCFCWKINLFSTEMHSFTKLHWLRLFKIRGRKRVLKGFKENTNRMLLLSWVTALFSFTVPMRQWAKSVSKPVNGAYDQSEHSEALQSKLAREQMDRLTEWPVLSVSCK